MDSNMSLPESDISEWKWSWRDEYMKWMAAFAFTNGGSINIGVNDDGYVVGLKDFRELLEALPNKFRDKLRITPEVRLHYASEIGTNIRYPNGVPDNIASKAVNQYACGKFNPKTENDRKKLEKWKSEIPVSQDPDGKYYYIEIIVNHYDHLLTYDGKAYTRSGSTLQMLEGQDLERAVLSLSSKNQNSFFVNKIYPVFRVCDLRKDLIDRARKMALARDNDHIWKGMSDEEMLRSCGLILTDELTGQQGLTLAAILLFGDDNLIMSVCYQNKTDAIVRIIDTDRYDDREVITTNLIDSYDRLMSFGQRHLNNRFVLNENGKGLEAAQSISARDKILREIISNVLVHRDFSSNYVAKMVIERDKIEITNANRPHGMGDLNVETFEPFPKNPAVSKVFREIGLADELGSGMRNSYKFTKLYSGGEPLFIEDGDVFRIIIPLNDAATVSAGPIEQADEEMKSNKTVVNGVVIKQSREKIEAMINFCIESKSAAEMMDLLQLKSRDYFRNNILKPMIQAGLLKPTIPDKPKSPDQRYIKA